MNGIDYSKAISENRDSYRKATQQMQEGKKAELKTKEENFESSKKRLASNYSKSLEKLEKDYDSLITNANERTSETLKKTNGDYHNDLAKERTRFSNETAKNTTNFRNTLEGLKESFNRALVADKKSHLDSQETAKKNYLDQSTSKQIKHDSELKSFVDRTKGVREKLSEREGQDRKKLIAGMDSDIYDLKKKAHENLTNVVDKKNDQIERMRSSNERMKDNLIYNYEEMNAQNRESHANALNIAKSDFDYKADQMYKDHVNDRRKNSEKLSETLQKESLNSYYEKDALKKKLAKINDGPGEGQVDMRRVSADDTKSDRKFDTLQRSTANERQEIYDRAESNRLGYLDTMKRRDAEKSKEFAQKEQVIMDEGNRKFDKARREKTDLTDHFKKIIESNQDSANNKNSMLEKRSKEQLKAETGKLNHRMNMVEENNKQAMANLRGHFSKRNKEIGLKAEKEKNELSTEMNLNFQQKIDKTTDMFEGKLKEVTKENLKKEEEFTDKLKKLEQNRVRELNYTQELNADIQQQNESSQKDLLMVKNNKQQVQLESLRDMYETRIDNLLTVQGKKMKSLVEVYEDKMQKLQADVQRSAQRDELAFKRESLRLKQEHDNVVRNMQATYENKLTELRQTQDAKIEQLRSFRQKETSS